MQSCNATSYRGEIFTRSMGAISIGDLAEAFKNKPNLTYKIIGRTMEKNHEELFTDFEAARSYRENDIYIIPERYNFGSNLNEQIELKYKDAIKCNMFSLDSPGRKYRS